ncbi:MULTISPECIES: type IV pilus modification protein PilV [Colwellia]|uniref:Type IV pilus modification protein PilV n=1 Tax=Colwellia marinimaniae TaxID=1513592 RepID=A0ABQ0MQZ5_9GAMM|nr:MULTISPECIES: type IV pilus modification protein PilV [Colwellia]GAW94763.1 type IV pilus modification protein PilV [Colwellia marinimaniae]
MMGKTINKFSSPRIKKQQGMSFIEVLIALVILVTGILGAVAMQITAKQGSFDAMQRSLASSLVQDIIARMRANAPLINPNLTLNQYARNDYGSAIGVAGNRCNLAPGCITADVISNDIYEWELALMGADVTSAGKNVGGLVGAAACISQNGNVYTVTVSWQAKSKTTDSAVINCGVSGAKRRQVVVQTFIYNI